MKQVQIRAREASWEPSRRSSRGVRRPRESMTQTPLVNSTAVSVKARPVFIKAQAD